MKVRKRKSKCISAKGEGLPYWVYFNKSIEKTDLEKKRLIEFLELRNSILDQIIWVRDKVPEGSIISLGLLGAESFKNHWFKTSKGQIVKTGTEIPHPGRLDSQ
ncbi:hypothetical protein ES702_07873 [subsurface metagenome]